jgi:hypothetical protein
MQYSAWAVASLVFCSCKGESVDSRPASVAPVVRQAQRPAAQRVAARHGGVTEDDFAKLKWLEGSWQGTMPAGQAFYTRYEFITPTRMDVYTQPYGQNALKHLVATIYLENGDAFMEQDGTKWLVLMSDTGERISLLPAQMFGNSQRWRRINGDQWEATIDQGGVVVTHTMWRVRI